MKLPSIELQKEMVAGHIAFLQRSFETGIDAHILRDKIKDEIRHVFRSAYWKTQMNYWNNCNEAIESLANDGSDGNCKTMIRAIIYDLYEHLDYLNIKFPSRK